LVTVVEGDIEELIARARALADAGGRRLLGITGAPGAGKSTIAARVVEALGDDAVLVPMDGFHLCNATLRALGRRNRKGAWDTFDADGYLHLLRRFRSREDAVVYAPDFDRDHDESIGSALPVPRAIPLVVTEGNYLLLDRGRWGEVRELLDEIWYVDAPEDVRLGRLVARHEQHGMEQERAVAWAHGTDQVNADLIASTRPRADLVVRLLD
jgi:pantothenate kinase